MRVDKTEVIPLLLPFEKSTPITEHWRLEGLFVAAVRLQAAGTEGIGYVYVFNRRYLRPLVAITQSLAELVTGRDISDIAEAWKLLEADVSSVSLQGLGQLGMAALDIALWDLRGKIERRSVAALLGQVKHKLPVYRSLYFLDAREPEACAADAATLTAQGFRAMKLGALHKNDPARDVARVAAVRDAIGPQGGILLDCFGARWSAEQALEFARMLEPYRLTWLEDPLAYDDVEGWSRLTRESPIPIATGEWLYAFKSLKELIDCKACNVLILDLPRVGGFTGWKQVADYADGRGVRLANHLMPEISVHAMAATPSAFMVEYAPSAAPLFESMPPFDADGELIVPSAPGLGLVFNRETLVRARLE